MLCIDLVLPQCEQCEVVWADDYWGDQCCDVAWDQWGFDCNYMESEYGWDCTGCNCSYDENFTCGDGSSTFLFFADSYFVSISSCL